MSHHISKAATPATHFVKPKKYYVEPTLPVRELEKRLSEIEPVKILDSQYKQSVDSQSILSLQQANSEIVNKRIYKEASAN